MVRNSSFSERPVRHGPRRLADWINLAGTGKVHSLVDKVYKGKNLYMAWERVKANGGAGLCAVPWSRMTSARLCIDRRV
jgi:hypothetical protein